MNIIRFYFWRLLTIATKKLHIFVVVFKKVGLKNLNFNLLTDSPTSSRIILVDFNDLFLGPDYLVDEFTLLDCPLLSSPHYELIKAISEDRDIRTTDYYDRFLNGKLDWRYLQNPKINLENRFLAKYKETAALLREDAYEPVKVYQVDKKYYIYDGKHRAAMCALNKLPVKCEEIDVSLAIGNIGGYMFSCIKSKPCFSKHNVFFNLLRGC